MAVQHLIELSNIFFEESNILLPVNILKSLENVTFSRVLNYKADNL